MVAQSPALAEDALEQADEAYKLFDKQSDGKGVFLI